MLWSDQRAKQILDLHASVEHPTWYKYMYMYMYMYIMYTHNVHLHAPSVSKIPRVWQLELIVT